MTEDKIDETPERCPSCGSHLRKLKDGTVVHTETRIFPCPAIMVEGTVSQV